jgi:flavin-dependent dehydrogenase
MVFYCIYSDDLTMKHAEALINTSFLIVGAGPAGLVLGIELRRQGFDVMILEAKAGTSRNVCGEYLSPQGVEILSELKLSSTLEGFEAIYGMKIVSPQLREILAEFPEHKSGVSLQRQVFQERLIAEYIKLGGQIQFGKKIIKIQDDIQEYVVHTEDGADYKSPNIVGADGRLSAVSRFLKMEKDPPIHKRVAVHCYLKPKTEVQRFGQMHILKDGSYVGINPIHSGEVNFSVVVDPEKITQSHGAKQLINHWIASDPLLSEQFDLVTTETIKTTYPITRLSGQITKKNATLIGDASGFIDPLTGEGITTAIKTAALLSKKIKESESLRKAFYQYSKARKKDYRQKEILNRALQIVIRFPILCEMIAHVLSTSQRLRELFIGVIGNIYTPIQAFKIYLRNLFRKEA